MRPVKPPIHMQSVTSSRNNKPKVKLQDNDRKCQEKKRPRKPRTHMTSVTNADNMWLPKPVTRRLCKDRYCQSTRCYKKHSDPRKRQKVQYIVKSNQSVNQEDATLDVTSEELSPRSQKSQVDTKVKNQANIRDNKTQA